MTPRSRCVQTLNSWNFHSLHCETHRSHVSFMLAARRVAEECCECEGGLIYLGRNNLKRSNLLWFFCQMTFWLISWFSQKNNSTFPRRTTGIHRYTIPFRKWIASKMSIFKYDTCVFRFTSWKCWSHRTKGIYFEQCVFFRGIWNLGWQ